MTVSNHRGHLIEVVPPEEQADRKQRPRIFIDRRDYSAEIAVPAGMPKDEVIELIKAWIDERLAGA